MGASKQKLLLGVGLHDKIIFSGAHPLPGPAGSTQPKGCVCFENWVGASKQKLFLGVSLPGKILFVGAYLNPRPTGSTPPKGGIWFKNWAGPANKSCSSGLVCLVKFYLWGLTPTRGLEGPPHKKGVYALRIERRPANKS